MEILHAALSYKLLNSASLPKEQKQMIKASVSKMDYNIMKDQLRKVFTNNADDLLPKNDLSEEKIKVEASNDVYYAKECNKSSYRGRGRCNFNKINKINNIKHFKTVKRNETPQILEGKFYDEITVDLSFIGQIIVQLNMNILHSLMSQWKHLFQSVSKWLSYIQVAPKQCVVKRSFSIFYSLCILKNINKLRYLTVKICLNLAINDKV